LLNASQSEKPLNFGEGIVLWYSFPMSPLLSNRPLKYLSLGLTLLLVASHQKVQAQLYINADTTINSTIGSLVYVGQNGHGGITNPTVAIVAGADIQTILYSYNTSTIDMNDGTISSTLFAYDTSRVNINGGTSRNLVAANTSTINMTSGTVMQLYGNNTGTVNVQGGTVSGGLYSYHSSTVNVMSGSVNGIFYVDHVANISGGTISSILEGHSTGVININSGTISGTVQTYNASILNVTGGILSNAINVLDTSVATINGGSTSSISAFNNSIINLRNGTVDSLYTYSTANLTGGNINYLFAASTGTVNIASGTTISGTLFASDTSTINLSGGVVSGSLYGQNTSIVNLIGGNTNNVYQYDSNIYNLYGTNLTRTLVSTNVTSTGAVDPINDLFSQYALGGTLSDGTSLAGKFLFVQNGSTGSFNLLASIPEPTTLALLTLGGIGLLCRKNKQGKRELSVE
jgi:hypothetical protein